MKRVFASLILVLGLVLCTAAVRAADDPGQDDLDKAMDANPKARTVNEMGDVIRLCESAKKKGLNKENAKFADALLCSTLFRRGLTVSEAILEAIHSGSPDPNWRKLRDFALTDLEQAVKIDPKQPEAQFQIARLELLPEGKRDRVLKALDEAIAASADNPKLHSKCLLMRSTLTDDLKKRRADLDEALQAEPQDPGALLNRALVLADLAKDDEKLYDAALADLKKLIELQPDHAGAYEARGLILFKLKKYDDALVAFEKAHDRNSKAPGPLVEEARIHAIQGNYPAALHTLERSIETNPGDLSGPLLRAAVYQAMGDKDKALADLDHLLKISPGLGPALRMRALLLAGEGKFQLAIEEMEKFRKEMPKDVDSLAQLAMLYSAEEEHEKAIELYSQVLAVKPNDFNALRGRGDAYLGVGKHAEAIADYERAYKLDSMDKGDGKGKVASEDSGLLNNFAWVLATSPDAKLRDGKRAVTLATEACRLTNYKLVHILSTLAAAYAETGDFKAAIQWSEKSVTLATNDQKADLRKELETYQAGKPVRERHLPKKEKPKETVKANPPDKTMQLVKPKVPVEGPAVEPAKAKEKPVKPATPIREKLKDQSKPPRPPVDGSPKDNLQ
jgi:tetratricopeptide (TPR) repeat protein